jgi:hypothetical protein
VFSIVENKGIISNSLKNSFNELEEDRYLKSDFLYRFRAFSHGKLKKENFHWESKSNFMQSSSINSYLGDVARQYPTIPIITQKFTEKIINKLILKQDIPKDDYLFGCHQIRVTASEQTA